MKKALSACRQRSDGEADKNQANMISWCVWFVLVGRCKGLLDVVPGDHEYVGPVPSDRCPSTINTRVDPSI